MELREKIAQAISLAVIQTQKGETVSVTDYADAILAIPEIKEALDVSEAARRQGLSLTDGALGVEYQPRG